MAATAVAQQVNDHVLAKALTVLECHTPGAHHSLGVVGVHMEHRSLGHTRNVGGVGCGASVLGGGGETDLVVDHNVHGAAGSVATQVRHLQGLHNDALPGECSITVDKDRQNRAAFNTLLVEHVLLGSHDTLKHSVDRLKVGGVSRQVHLGLLARVRGVRTFRAQMVLDITRAVPMRRLCGAAEFTENLCVRLPSDISQHVKAATVRHTNSHTVHVFTGGLVNNRIKQRDERLTALKGETFLAQVLGLQEVLKRLSLNQLIQHTQQLFTAGLGITVLQLVLEPLAHLGAFVVHVFHG